MTAQYGRLDRVNHRTLWLPLTDHGDLFLILNQPDTATRGSFVITDTSDCSRIHDFQDPPHVLIEILHALVRAFEPAPIGPNRMRVASSGRQPT